MKLNEVSKSGDDTSVYSPLEVSGVSHEWSVVGILWGRGEACRETLGTSLLWAVAEEEASCGSAWSLEEERRESSGLGLLLAVRLSEVDLGETPRVALIIPVTDVLLSGDILLEDAPLSVEILLVEALLLVDTTAAGVLEDSARGATGGGASWPLLPPADGEVVSDGVRGVEGGGASLSTGGGSVSCPILRMREVVHKTRVG